MPGAREHAPRGFIDPPLVWLGLLAATHLAMFFCGITHEKGKVEMRDAIERGRVIELKNEDQRLANRAAAALRASREALAEELAKKQGALDAALNRPTKKCPARLGDAVIPGDVWMRLKGLDGAAGVAARPTPFGADSALP